jgi:uncharacterized protein (TIGR02118 family)
MMGRGGENWMLFKIVTKGYAKEGMSKDEYINYWLNKHAPLVKRVLGNKLKKYVIRPVVFVQGEDPGYDGTAELLYETTDDVKTMMSSPPVRQVLADAPNFNRKVTMVIVEEHTIL